MKKNIIILLFLISLISTSIFAQNKIENDQELLNLSSYMIGSYSSIEQSKADTNFFDIHLQMVRIWEDRDDAIWLYVEQAASWALQKPYRQRVYKVTRSEDDSFESTVFTFEKPLRFAGKYTEPTAFDVLTPDSLEEREGCSIFLHKTESGYSGSTVKRNCVSNLRGATYATSEVIIESKVLNSWDRGFDADGKQVWGAETGPYIFKKK